MDGNVNANQQYAEMMVTLANAVSLISDTFKRCTGENVSGACGDNELKGDLLNDQIAIQIQNNFGHLLK